MMKHARVMACLTFVSRLLGLVREQALTYCFGTGEVLSAFRIAFMIPNLARRLFGEGALSAAMVPVLTKTIHKDGPLSGRRLVGAILWRVGLFLGGLTLVAELVLAVWRHFSVDFSLTLSAVLLPYMVVICLVAILGAVLNVNRRFAAPAAMPLVLNGGIILAVVLGAWLLGLNRRNLMFLICGAILLAGLVQLHLIRRSLVSISFGPMLGRAPRDAVRKVWRLMAPMALGVSAVQLNTLADYLIANAFIVRDGERVGAAVLGTASFLYQLPLGVFGIAIATAIFPALAEHAAHNRQRAFGDVLGQGLRLALLLSLPASVGLMFVARPLVAALYERGEFDAVCTRHVSATLFFYSIGLAAYFVNHVIVRAFYSLTDSASPARIASGMVLLNLSLNLALVGPLQERGLALASAISAAIQTVILGVVIQRRHTLRIAQTTGSGVWRMVACTGLMAAALYAATTALDTVAIEHALVRLGILVTIGVAVYAGACKFLVVEEWNLILSRWR
ncbi:MAG: murein biosynthesis integral membrane protein MurJ [Phycisphaerae bacterium]